MVRFTIYLEVIEKENLIHKAAENGRYLISKLQELSTEYSDLISNVRGLGLFCAYDLSSADVRNRLIDIIQEEGALVLGCGQKSIRFRPHLNISIEDIDLGVSIMRNALKRL